MFWRNAAISNGCGIFIKEGRVITEIGRSADFFDFSASNNESLTITPKVSITGEMYFECMLIYGNAYG